MPHRLLKNLDILGAWIGFGVIQLEDLNQWMKDHPTLTEFIWKLFCTAVFATLYHFTLKYWKKRDEKKGD